MDSIGEQLLIGTPSEKQSTLSAQLIKSQKAMSAATADGEQFA
jgi:hypothetical protein